jgi:hypothetical protein
MTTKKGDSKTKILIVGDSQSEKISEAIRSACDNEVDSERIFPSREELKRFSEAIELTKELKYSQFEHKSKFHK